MLLLTMASAANSDLGITVDVNWLEQVLIPRAVRQYSLYAGEETEATITTEPGEDEYDLPADCALVTDVLWWPSSSDVLTGDLIAPAIVDTSTSQGYGYTRPSEFLIDNINRAAVTKQLRGHWRQKNTDTLVLDPEPTAGGLAVTVTYLKMHVLTGTGAARAYATIPDHHLDALVLLTKAEYLEAMAERASLKDDFRQGGTQITRAHVPGNAQKQASRLRTKAQALLGVSGAVGGTA
jgi:hypothetical protein